MAEPTLDGLPLELKIMVLREMPDPKTMTSLVRSSCGYYEAYHMDKPEILKRLVKQQYTGFVDLAEALTAIRSKNLHFTVDRSNAIALLDRWRRRKEIRERKGYKITWLDEPDSAEESIALLRFRNVLSFFVHEFTKIEQGSEVEIPDQPKLILPLRMVILPLRLAPSESDRFVKGLCRLQTMHHIFGDRIRCLKYMDWGWESALWDDARIKEFRKL
ncbi:hypothetical protein N7466_003203 [Penicillium verhagenii]|uniref:uncharacterized protein n=1 Tax=Penicillium verhagenii TaxID=1562060 RepID=UPI0025459E8F|nr:uncharacterized protein N7466_003203 [Penicillium verhagenii]KAJ5936753.1 hypothetical protein N7466_003203 [Penicillium verhagenii]